MIFTDGACSGNPGPGGWGAIIADNKGHVKELGGGSQNTTNNKMEIQAALGALLHLSGTSGSAVIYTDSVYVIKGITQWIWGWTKNNWKTAEGNDVANRELWQELARVVAKRAQSGNKIVWKYCRGHSGIPGNERCDTIAVQFSQQKSVQLFSGSRNDYFVDINQLPRDEALPEKKTLPGVKAKAFSYVSLIGGKIFIDYSWPACEARVKSRPGVKFKKAMSEGEESEIIESWGAKSLPIERAKN